MTGKRRAETLFHQGRGILLHQGMELDFPCCSPFPPCIGQPVALFIEGIQRQGHHVGFSTRVNFAPMKIDSGGVQLRQCPAVALHGIHPLVEHGDPVVLTGGGLPAQLSQLRCGADLDKQVLALAVDGFYRRADIGRFDHRPRPPGHCRQLSGIGHPA